MESHDVDVLLVPTVGGVGGCTRVVGDLARLWRDIGLKVKLVFPDPQSEETAASLSWLKSEGIEAEASGEVAAWYQAHGLGQALRLRKWIRSQNVRRTYLHFGSNQIAFWDVLGARLAGPTYLMVHHAARLQGRRRRILTRLGALLAKKVVVSTPAMRDLLIDIGVRPSKIAVVPLAVRPPAIHPSRQEARTSLGLPEDEFIVSMVARLDRGKNAEKLVEIVNDLVSEGCKMHLVVAGRGETLDLVRERAEELLAERGHILGFTDSVELVYAASDVFALPSEEEGFGLVFLESAWFGVPSVGFDVGGVRYAIADGETGFTVPAMDWNGFREALRRFVNDPPLVREMGRRAAGRVASEFSPTMMADRHRKVLRI